MGRSSKKGPFIDPHLYKKIQALNQSGEKKMVRTWSRDCVVIPEFVGHTIGVHNGRKFVPVFISEQMVGHKLGEFSLTRFFRSHGEAHTKEASELT
ncbi:MAG: 30S ribosomal protein S19 [Elusimicrobia bacterium RIFOXYA2_FULL_40_6]|nr:MAG: 30S ribosomal protein S19 [Elusimicrobia bacterium RIFOXYA2_FULL_40_6]